MRVVACGDALFESGFRTRGRGPLTRTIRSSRPAGRLGLPKFDPVEFVLCEKTILPGAKLDRVSGPYGGRARDGGDQNEPKERAPRDWVPSGLSCVLQPARGAATAHPCADAERACPLRAPSGSFLAAFQYSAASNG